MILVHPLIDPVIVSFGILQIRWYGLAYVLGFVIGYYFLRFNNKKYKKPIDNKHIENFFIWSVLGVIIGGRLGYMIFYQTSEVLNNPISIIYIWKGGMSFHGGLLGLILTTLYFCKKTKIIFFQLTDLISIVAPIGIFFGRIANFINTELYGRITDLKFAMIYPNIDNYPRHPSQLYEALFEGIILFFIMFQVNTKINNKYNFGINTSIFLITYSFFRFFLEFLREPDSHLGLYLNFFSMGQVLCIPMILLGIIIMYKKINK